MSEEQNLSETPENELPQEETVLLRRDQYDQLLLLLTTYRNDIVSLVQVFQAFSGLFQGKSNMLSMLPVITKLFNDPKQLDQFQHILPIIEKYTHKPVENAENQE